MVVVVSGKDVVTRTAGATPQPGGAVSKTCNWSLQ
jgi:hypothetical protein